jgi:hypothetical protein
MRALLDLAPKRARRLREDVRISPHNEGYGRFVRITG